MKPIKDGWYWARFRNDRSGWQPVQVFGSQVYTAGAEYSYSFDQAEFHPYAGEIQQPD